MEFRVHYYDLPIESACCHNDWKVRLFGYQKAFEIFLQIEDKNSCKWDSFIEIIKAFVVDKNQQCLMKALLAVLIFVKKCGMAAITTKDVIKGIINNCLESDQNCIISLAVDIIFCYIKIGQYEVVNNEFIDVITTTENKKQIGSCLFLIGEIIKFFGISATELKKLADIITPLIHVENLEIKTEAVKLLKQLILWATPEVVEAMKQTLAQFELKFIKHGENGTVNSGKLGISSVSNGKVQHNLLANVHEDFPDNFWSDENSDPQSSVEYQDLRLTEVLNTNISDNGSETNNIHIENASLIIMNHSALEKSGNHHQKKVENISTNLRAYVENPLYLLEKFKKGFLKKRNAKKYEELEQLLNNILSKLIVEDDLSRWLESLFSLAGKTFPLDISCVTIKCISLCANFLKASFETYIPLSMPIIFQKFEEKQTELSKYLRECIDSIFDCTNLESLQGTLISIYKRHRNPLVKMEINSFLIRCFSKSRQDLKSDYMKTYYNCLTMDLNSQHFHVRDSAVQALGTALRLAEEKSLDTFLIHVKDFMLTKIKKYAKSIELSSQEEGPAAPEVEEQICNIPNKSNPTDSGEPNEENENGELDWETGSDMCSSEDGYSDEVNNFRHADMDENWEETLKNLMEEEQNFGDSPEEQEEERDYIKFNKHHKQNFKLETEGNDSSNLEDINNSEINIGINNNQGKYGDKEMNISLLDYPEWNEYIDFECAEELLIRNKVDISQEVHERKKSKHVLRSTGNDVKDQLIRNIYRKYHSETSNGQRDSLSAELSKTKCQLRIPDDIVQSLGDKDLSVRRRTIGRIQFLVNCLSGSIDSCSPSLKKVVGSIVERISDCSLEISLSAIFLLESLMVSMGSSSEKYIEVLFPSLLKAAADPRPGMHMTSFLFIKKWEELCGIEMFFKVKLLSAVEKGGSFAERQVLWKWVAVSLLQMPTNSVQSQELISLLRLFYQHIVGTKYQLNETHLASYLGFMRHLEPKDVLDACKRNSQLKHISKTILDNKKDLFPCKLHEKLF